MNFFAKFDEIPSMTLRDIKETKRHGHTFARTFVRMDRQRENSIPSHKHRLRGGGGIISTGKGNGRQEEAEKYF